MTPLKHFFLLRTLLLFFLIAYALLAQLLAPARLCAEQNGGLRVLYLERPPYSYTSNGAASGFLIDAARKVFSNAGLPVTFESSPSAPALLQEIKHIGSNACGLDWLKTMEREVYAHFSVPFYISKPLAAMAMRANASRFLPKGSLQSLARDKNLRLGVIEGYSYGANMDQMLQVLSPSRTVVAGDQRRLMALLKKNAFDYVLISPEEIVETLAVEGLTSQDVVIIPLSDAPPSLPGHIICNRGVNFSVMERIDEAIGAVGRAHWP